MATMDDPNENLALVKHQGSALATTGTEGSGIAAPVSQTGINHLAMNAVIPGLGSLVRGQRGLGAAQLGLAVLAIPVLWKSIMLGLLMFAGAWVWSLVTGIGFVKASNRAETGWR